MDKESLPNGLDPYNTCFQWKFKPEPAGTGHPLNYHPNAAERVAMIGTDPDNPWDLGGEIEFVIGNEKHVIDRPCIVYVPKMMKHGQNTRSSVRQADNPGACAFRALLLQRGMRRGHEL